MNEESEKKFLLDNFGFIPIYVQIPGQMQRRRQDQVVNHQKGFVFTVDDLTRIRRFLILGTSGGTFYVSEKKLTMQNLQSLIEIIDTGNGGIILREIIEISLAGRAPKQDPTMFALALCARYRTLDWKKNSDDNFGKYIHELQQCAFRAVHRVCRTSTHLFAFVKYCEVICKAAAASAVANKESDEGSGEENKDEKSKTSTGWGRSMRKCISEWYLNKSPMELALQITKYKNREGYSHRDLLRLSHPRASKNAAKSSQSQDKLSLLYDQILHFACEGSFDKDKFEYIEPPLKRQRCDYYITEEAIQSTKDSLDCKFLLATIDASKLKNTAESEEQCADLIRKYDLVREHIPNDLLNSQIVWMALLEKMPMTALIRNLSKLSSIGLISGKDSNFDFYVDTVVRQITDEGWIQNARIHPLSVLLASSVYTNGQGIRGKLEWEVNEKIKDALDKAFLLAFKNLEPTGKRYCLGIDVSGSMMSPIQNGVLSCREASAAMSAVFLRTEEKVECMGFQRKFVPLPFTKSTTVQEIVKYCSNLPFGGTDCSLPMTWALKNKKKFDVFIVFTDSETYYGEIHPFEALKKYRTEMEIPEAKLIVMGMTATEFTIADPTDPGMLDVVGLDSSIPELVRSFVLGEI